MKLNIEVFKATPIEWENRIAGLILSSLAFFVVVATYRATKNSWVIMIASLVILMGVMYVA
jgi:hypothetical protein